mgnify:CR=1 FL=1
MTRLSVVRFGEKKVSSLAPGKNVYQSFNARATSVPAGTAPVSTGRDDSLVALFARAARVGEVAGDAQLERALAINPRCADAVDARRRLDKLGAVKR